MKILFKKLSILLFILIFTACGKIIIQMINLHRQIIRPTSYS